MTFVPNFCRFAKLIKASVLRAFFTSGEMRTHPDVGLGRASRNDSPWIKCA
jgi:hypothetical protein